MPDISHTLIAKSDQLNAADLARPVVITVRSVRVVDEEQPVCIDYGENRPAWKPCKGMRRLLAQVWGTDTDTWIGHRVELFNDNGATWAGKAVGGIRVSAISGIDRGMSYNMRTSKKSHTMYKIAPMEKAQPVDASAARGKLVAYAADRGVTEAQIVAFLAHHGSKLDDLPTADLRALAQDLDAIKAHAAGKS